MSFARSVIATRPRSWSRRTSPFMSRTLVTPRSTSRLGRYGQRQGIAWPPITNQPGRSARASPSGFGITSSGSRFTSREGPGLYSVTFKGLERRRMRTASAGRRARSLLCDFQRARAEALADRLGFPAEITILSLKRFAASREERRRPSAHAEVLGHRDVGQESLGLQQARVETPFLRPLALGRLQRPDYLLEGVRELLRGGPCRPQLAPQNVARLERPDLRLDLRSVIEGAWAAGSRLRWGQRIKQTPAPELPGTSGLRGRLTLQQYHSIET